MLGAMGTLLLALLISGCGGGGGGALGEVIALALSPESASLTTSADEPESVQLVATATFANGEVVEGYELVSWGVTNAAAGSVDRDGLFTTSLQSGGQTLVMAEAGGVVATAEITVVYEQTEAAGGATDDALAAFAGDSTDGGDALRWVYPPDGVAVPRNLPEFSFMWADDTGSDLYLLTFVSDTTNVKVVTDEPSFTASDDLWRVITATNAGGEVTVSLAAAASTGGGVIEGGDRGFRVNRFDAFGAVYYWSSAASGVVRSVVDAVEPEVWFGPENGTTEHCVGCHVINDAGDRIAFSWELSAEEHLMGLASIDEEGSPEALLDLDEERDPGAFSTFSPDGDYVVFARGGALRVYDGRTGASVGRVESSLKLTQPHWSPDGDKLVAVSATGLFDSDTSFYGGEIVVLPYLGGGRFGDADVLILGVTGGNQYYPMFSPDGEWVVFNRSTGTSYFDTDATLWLVSAEGGDPIKLDNANQDRDLTNSWPRWGPIPDDDVLWLAFASTRDYGTASTDGTAHIWVTAIDTDKAEQGEDPSSPAFWLVQQVVGEGNHAPWWSLY